MFCTDELFSFLLVCEILSFSFHTKWSSCWVKYHKLQVILFQDFEYIMPLSSAKFLQRNQLKALHRFPHIWLFVFLLVPLEFFFFNFWHFNFDVLGVVLFEFYLVWGPLCFLYLDICFLLKVCEVFFFLFFWPPHRIYSSQARDQIWAIGVT